MRGTGKFNCGDGVETASYKERSFTLMNWNCGLETALHKVNDPKPLLRWQIRGFQVDQLSGNLHLCRLFGDFCSTGGKTCVNFISLNEVPQFEIYRICRVNKISICVAWESKWGVQLFDWFSHQK
jgi:hypothetical protein